MKIIIFSDLVINSGFGRIGNEVGRRLQQRGHEILGLGLFYGGQPHNIPFWVYPLAGRDIWAESANIINSSDADVVLSIQDFPYHVSLYRDCPIDWSRRKHVYITPIDGTPIAQEWVAFAKIANGGLVISEFGVEALRQVGVRVDLCPPGVNRQEFFPAEPEEKKALRIKAGLDPDAFIVGMMGMNQGRKNIPGTIEGFMEFAKDKPNAYLYLDMDRSSPGGWNIPDWLVGPIGVPADKIIYRDQVQGHLPGLRDRYCILDVHSLLSFREGFGLPSIEAQACRIPIITQDWCSGNEIGGDGRGYVTKILPTMLYGTWGGAKDAIPDLADYVSALNVYYYDEPYRLQVANVGYRSAIARTWDKAVDNVEEVLKRVVGNNPSVREPSRGPEVSQSTHSSVASVGNGSGDNSSGRLQPENGLPDNSRSASDMYQKFEELGVRGELQPGGANGTRQLTPVPE